jgi:hypothetical protein
MPASLILQLLPLIISAVEGGYSFIVKARGALQQSTELTPEEEKLRDAHFADLESKDWWQAD